MDLTEEQRGKLKFILECRKQNQKNSAAAKIRSFKSVYLEALLTDMETGYRKLEILILLILTA